MASKEKNAQPKEIPEETAADAVEANVTPQTEEPQREQPWRLLNGVTYLERSWRELPMYQCPACAYNNVELDDFARHQAFVCKRPECPIPQPTPAATPRPSPVLDRYGNPVQVMEER